MEDERHLGRWVDDTIDAYLKAKDEARIKKWIDKNASKVIAKGWYAAVINDGTAVSVAPTKCATVEAFLATNPKYAGKQVEIRR